MKGDDHLPDTGLDGADLQFRIMVDAVRDDAICMLDTRGHVASWNRGAERIKGLHAGGARPPRRGDRYSLVKPIDGAELHATVGALIARVRSP